VFLCLVNLQLSTIHGLRSGIHFSLSLASVRWSFAVLMFVFCLAAVFHWQLSLGWGCTHVEGAQSGQSIGLVCGQGHATQKVRVNGARCSECNEWTSTCTPV
jgi:hypothetical protein